MPFVGVMYNYQPIHKHEKHKICIPVYESSSSEDLTLVNSWFKECLVNSWFKECYSLAVRSPKTGRHQ
jgi:hypothetical protein